VPIVSNGLKCAPDTEEKADINNVRVVAFMTPPTSRPMNSGVPYIPDVAEGCGPGSEVRSGITAIQILINYRSMVPEQTLGTAYLKISP